MTDEEKAIKAVCEECDSYWYCFNKKQLGDCVYNRMYVKGLEEGRKEKQIIIDLQTVEIESRDVYLAEKENIILRQQSEIEQLKKGE